MGGIVRSTTAVVRATPSYIALADPLSAANQLHARTGCFKVLLDATARQLQPHKFINVPFTFASLPRLARKTLFLVNFSWRCGEEWLARESNQGTSCSFCIRGEASFYYKSIISNDFPAPIKDSTILIKRKPCPILKLSRL